MPFYGELPTEERTSDSGSKYLVKIDPTKQEAKNKAAAQPGPVTSETAKGEQPKAK
jgi:hypothetical protein